MSDSLIDDLNAYHRFMGWFITQFAEFEFHARRLLRMHSGMDDEAYEILVGLPRTSDTTQKLRKLITSRLSDEEAISAVDDALQQLKNTTKLRDWVVHYGGHPVDSGFLVRLKPTEISEDTGKSFHVFQKDELWAAVQDNQLIQNIILYRTDSSLPQDFRDSLRVNAVRTKPWLYKSPQLARIRQ